MIFVNRALRIGRSPISGVTYTREALEKMVDDWKLQSKPLFGLFGESRDQKVHIIDLTKVATQVVDMYVDDEGLVVHQKTLDTELGKEFERIVQALENDEFPSGTTLRVSPNMTGTLDNGYTATELKMFSVRIEIDTVSATKAE